MTYSRTVLITFTASGNLEKSLSNIAKNIALTETGLYSLKRNIQITGVVIERAFTNMSIAAGLFAASISAIYSKILDLGQEVERNATLIQNALNISSNNKNKYSYNDVLNGIKQISMELPNTTNEVANLEYRISKLGIASNQALKTITKNALILGNIYNEDSEMYGVIIKNASNWVANGAKLTKETINKVSSELAVATQISSLNLQKIRYTMQNASGSFRTLGFSFEDLLTAATVISQQVEMTPTKLGSGLNIFAKQLARLPEKLDKLDLNKTKDMLDLQLSKIDEKILELQKEQNGAINNQIKKSLSLKIKDLRLQKKELLNEYKTTKALFSLQSNYKNILYIPGTKKLKPFGEILKSLNEEINKLSNGDNRLKVSIINKLFGGDGTTAILTLLKFSKNYDKVYKQIINSKGGIEKLNNMYNNLLKSKIGLMKSKLEVIGIDIYQNTVKNAKKIVDTINKYLDKIYKHSDLFSNFFNKLLIDLNNFIDYVGQKFINFLDDLNKKGDNPAKRFVNSLKNLYSTFESIGKNILDTFNKTSILDLLTSGINIFNDALKQIIRILPEVYNKFSNYFNKIKDVIFNNMDLIKKGLITITSLGILSQLTGIFNFITGIKINPFKSLLNIFSSLGVSILGIIVGLNLFGVKTNSILNNIYTGFNNLNNEINNNFDKFKEKIILLGTLLLTYFVGKDYIIHFKILGKTNITSEELKIKKMKLRLDELKNKIKTLNEKKLKLFDLIENDKYIKNMIRNVDSLDNTINRLSNNYDVLKQLGKTNILTTLNQIKNKEIAISKLNKEITLLKDKLDKKYKLNVDLDNKIFNIKMDNLKKVIDKEKSLGYKIPFKFNFDLQMLKMYEYQVKNIENQLSLLKTMNISDSQAQNLINYYINKIELLKKKIAYEKSMLEKPSEGLTLKGYDLKIKQDIKISKLETSKMINEIRKQIKDINTELSKESLKLNLNNKKIRLDKLNIELDSLKNKLNNILLDDTKISKINNNIDDINYKMGKYEKQISLLKTEYDDLIYKNITLNSILNNTINIIKDISKEIFNLGLDIIKIWSPEPVIKYANNIKTLSKLFNNLIYNVKYKINSVNTIFDIIKNNMFNVLKKLNYTFEVGYTIKITNEDNAIKKLSKITNKFDKEYKLKLQIENIKSIINGFIDIKNEGIKLMKNTPIFIKLGLDYINKYISNIKLFDKFKNITSTIINDIYHKIAVLSDRYIKIKFDVKIFDKQYFEILSKLNGLFNNIKDNFKKIVVDNIIIYSNRMLKDTTTVMDIIKTKFNLLRNKMPKIEKVVEIDGKEIAYIDYLKDFFAEYENKKMNIYFDLIGISDLEDALNNLKIQSEEIKDLLYKINYIKANVKIEGYEDVEQLLNYIRNIKSDIELINDDNLKIALELINDIEYNLKHLDLDKLIDYSKIRYLENNIINKEHIIKTKIIIDKTDLLTLKKGLSISPGNLNISKSIKINLNPIVKAVYSSIKIFINKFEKTISAIKFRFGNIIKSINMGGIVKSILPDISLVSSAFSKFGNKLLRFIGIVSVIGDIIFIVYETYNMIQKSIEKNLFSINDAINSSLEKLNNLKPFLMDIITMIGGIFDFIYKGIAFVLVGAFSFVAPIFSSIIGGIADIYMSIKKTILGIFNYLGISIPKVVNIFGYLGKMLSFVGKIGIWIGNIITGTIRIIQAFGIIIKPILLPIFGIIYYGVKTIFDTIIKNNPYVNLFIQYIKKMGIGLSNTKNVFDVFINGIKYIGIGIIELKWKFIGMINGILRIFNKSIKLPGSYKNDINQLKNDFKDLLNQVKENKTNNIPKNDEFNNNDINNQLIGGGSTNPFIENTKMNFNNNTINGSLNNMALKLNFNTNKIQENLNKTSKIDSKTNIILNSNKTIQTLLINQNSILKSISNSIININKNTTHLNTINTISNKISSVISLLSEISNEVKNVKVEINNNYINENNKRSFSAIDLSRF